MWRYIFLAVSMMGFAISGPEMLQKMVDARKIDKASSADKELQSSALTKIQLKPDQPKKRNYNPLAGRTARAQMNENGHFYFDSKMNGVSVKVMVDTGATGVAINRTTARRLGIRLKDSDFKYKSNTANGIAYYASTMIDEIQIGRIIVSDVRAAVLSDTSLSSTLLGMTFLRKLRKFEINRETLILTQ